MERQQGVRALLLEYLTNMNSRVYNVIVDVIMCIIVCSNEFTMSLSMCFAILANVRSICAK